METIIEEDLPMQIDVVQWHPKFQNILAIGAYQLELGNSEVRLGRIYILKATREIPGNYQIPLEHQTQGGVLDLKFSPSTSHPLAVATSSGLYIYSLLSTPEDTTMNLIVHIPTTHMALYTQWMSVNSLIFSDADGFLNIVEDNRLTKRKKVHEALTWIVYYSGELGTIYCGSDDGKFTCFDINNFMNEQLHFVKKYEVGVTWIGSFKDLVAVGGYNDTLTIFQQTPAIKPHLTELTRMNLGGAIWRGQFLQNDSNLFIAVACARNGIKILKYENENLSIVFENLKYEGCLAYGLDCKIVNSKFMIASGYYDNHVLHVFMV